MLLRRLGCHHPVLSTRHLSPCHGPRAYHQQTTRSGQGSSLPRPLLLSPGAHPPRVRLPITRLQNHNIRTRGEDRQNITLHQSLGHDGNSTHSSIPYLDASTCPTILDRKTASRSAPLTVRSSPSFDLPIYCNRVTDVCEILRQIRSNDLWLGDIRYVDVAAVSGAGAERIVHQPASSTTSEHWYCIIVGAEVGIFTSW